VEAVDPARLVSDALARGPSSAHDRHAFIVVAAGKASVSMASAFAAAFPDRILSGVVAAPGVQGGGPLAPLELFAAAHPYPNADSERAGRRALELATAIPAEASLIVLLSGGASATLAVPAPGITRDEKGRTTRLLMNAGVPIDALNCVRKHLSAIKGGRLAAAARGAVTLAISDVHAPVADDPAVIGSGPTVADPTTYGDALEIVRRTELQLRSAQQLPAEDRFPRDVVRHLERGASGELEETIKPGDPRLARTVYHVIGSRISAMQGAAEVARELGYAVRVIQQATAGDARDAGGRFVDAARRDCADIAGRACVIASGETTVHVRGTGHGGRNQEFALGAAGDLGRSPRAEVLASAGTDGVDGPTDAAGAIVDSSTVQRAHRAGLDATAALQRNDAYPFFEALGDLIVWGPTGTNVGDLHVYMRG
jgi:glycerate-2-kinase